MFTCKGCKYYKVCGEDESELPCGGYSEGEEIDDEVVTWDDELSWG